MHTRRLTFVGLLVLSVAGATAVTGASADPPQEPPPPRKFGGTRDLRI
jgi:hypothetical protein